MEVVGEAADAASGIAVVLEVRPDVVVCDVSLPIVSGLELSRDITAQLPDVRVLILTMHPPEDFADEALRAGATGISSKGESAEAILDAIRKASRNELYIADRQLPSVPPAITHAVSTDDPVAILSRRESEIFTLVVMGLSNESLAKRLSISIKTVETHRASINRKLGVHSTAELVRFAARNGLLPPA